MSPTIVSLSNQVWIDVSALTDVERESLREFLLEQDKIEAVEERLLRRNPYSPDHFAWLHLVPDFVVQVGAGLTVLGVQKLIEAWSGSRKEANERETFIIVVVGDDNTITVERPNSKKKSKRRQGRKRG